MSRHPLRLLWSQIQIPFYLATGFCAIIGIAKFAIPSDDLGDLKKTSETESDEEFKKVDWRVLRDLDLKSGGITERLRILNSKKIQVPGFLVPLEDNQTEVSEFLLVPSPQACIHVPPPPANQMIYVKMQTPVKFRWGYRAFWVQGVLSIKTVESPYGTVSYEMKGIGIKPFQFGHDL